MLEYVFFDRRPQQKFLQLLRQLGIESVLHEEDDIFEVAITEDLDDAVSDQIEDFYDQMMELNQALVDEGEASEGDYQTAGVVLNLKDGQVVYASIEPQLLSRVMAVLTAEEFNDVVNAIVDAVENPDSRSLCQRQQDQD